LLFEDRDAGGLERASQFRGIAPAGNAGNLSRGETDDVVVRIPSKYDIEIVEVTPCGTEYQDFFRFHELNSLFSPAQTRCYVFDRQRFASTKTYSFGLLRHMGTHGFQV